MNRLAKKNHSIFKRKLKGGALYIAIIISIVIGVILSLFILLAHYNQRTITVFTQSTQLYYNLKSGFEIAQSNYYTPELNDKWFKNSVNDDSIKIKKVNWGSYLLIHVLTKNRHQSLSQTGLFGTYMNPDTALMVSDNIRAVSLSGKIEFKANCYLPKAGIKPAFIEKQIYQSSAQTNSFIKTTHGYIPNVNDAVIKGLKEQLNLSVYIDSMVSNIPDYMNHSFHSKTVAFEFASTQLSYKNWKNNIKVISKNYIELDSTCHLDNILIVCKKIKFKEGFKGSVHIIATDSIITEKKCNFLYPSSFTLFSEENQSNHLKCIIINEDCQFSGGIIALNQNKLLNKSKVLVKLHATCKINGLIYSTDYTHIEGHLNATLITNALLIKTRTSAYENTILGCEIDPKKYANILAIPLLFKTNSKLKCCKKINT